MKFDVAVLGSLHLDIVIEGSPLPRTDETVFGKSWGMKCGGKGGNQAVAAALLGARTQFLGSVGDDDFGRTLTRNLEDHGVNIEAVAVNPALRSGMSAAIVDEAGDYGASVVSGANQAVPLYAAEAFDARFLLLQNEVGEASNVAGAAAARRRGALVLMNTAPWRALPQELIGAVDIFILNRVEAEQAGARLAGKTRIVTRGGNGLTVFDDAGEHVITAHRVTVKSTHGAGDCFCGALAAGLARGLPLREAARFANAAAAVFVTGAPLTPDSVTGMLGGG